MSLEDVLWSQHRFYPYLEGERWLNDYNFHWHVYATPPRPDLKEPSATQGLLFRYPEGFVKELPAAPKVGSDGNHSFPVLPGQ